MVKVLGECSQGHLWLPAKSVIHNAPVHLQDWLTNTQSLTLRLSNFFHTKVIVNVLEQNKGMPDSSELSAIGCTGRGKGFIIRRVQLVIDDIPRVYARSIFPEGSLVTPDKKILQLDDTPLGKWLFTHPELFRSSFEITKTSPQKLPCDAFHSLKEALIENQIWARRSLFSLPERPPVLVSEYFITRMQETIKNTAHLKPPALQN